jgi:hypothetical protein
MVYRGRYRSWSAGSRPERLLNGETTREKRGERALRTDAQGESAREREGTERERNSGAYTVTARRTAVGSYCTAHTRRRGVGTIISSTVDLRAGSRLLRHGRVSVVVAAAHFGAGFNRHRNGHVR